MHHWRPLLFRENLALHVKRCGCTTNLDGASILGKFSNARANQILETFHAKRLGASYFSEASIGLFQSEIGLLEECVSYERAKWEISKNAFVTQSARARMGNMTSLVNGSCIKEATPWCCWPVPWLVRSARAGTLWSVAGLHVVLMHCYWFWIGEVTSFFIFNRLTITISPAESQHLVFLLRLSWFLALLPLIVATAYTLPGKGRETTNAVVAYQTS